MNHLEVDLKLGILVLEGVETMRGGNQDLLHPGFDKGLDVLPGQAFEQCFITRLAHTLAAAILLGTQYPEIYSRRVKDTGRGLGDFLQSRIIAGIAAREIEHLRAFGELVHSRVFRPIGPVLRILSPGITDARKARHDTPKIGDARRNDTVRHQQPANGPHHVDDLYASGAPLNTVTAGGAQPEVFGFERNNAEFCLIDDSANEKLPHTIPRTSRIAFSALIAEFEGVSTRLFDAIDDYFKGL